MTLHLSKNDQEIINTILQKYRNNFEFFAFGSRVKGNHKKYSDLDLAVIDLKKTGLTKLQNEFDDSNLSITVDIVDLDTISEDFKKLIEDEKIAI